MATLEERIRDLEAEIVKNTVRFDKAVDEGNEGREKMYANLITATRNEVTESKKTLNLLLQQQSQAQGE
jgi:hypothetical protein